MVPEINLLPKMERRRSNNLFVILGVILFVVLILSISMQLFTSKKDINALTTEETQLAVERDVLSAQVSSTNLTEGQGSLSSAVDFVEGVSYPVSPLMDEVQSLLVDNTYLRDYQFDETGVILSADFETMNDLSIFIEKLIESSYFADVKVEQISSFEPVDNADEVKGTDFDVQARYSATLNLSIDQTFLSKGGARR
ncbi:malate synthase [Psychrobacillus glaciei]|uniref:Malate synthase n=1 Tax=Psychrobacillus glaciei TaxID=2283160 RepID=A0A5J6SPC2_9BACI|nr:PilN domain-containing protein [Psychrobacillus glaciei]QFF99569.1 malate synthase [Psychrobacillus glaciei]